MSITCKSFRQGFGTTVTVAVTPLDRVADVVKIGDLWPYAWTTRSFWRGGFMGECADAQPCCGLRA